MNYSVNSFGFLPTNPDIYFDSYNIGIGTDRPIGFSFPQIFKLYWTVKSFKIDAAVYVSSDDLSYLISGGGATSILGVVSLLSSLPGSSKFSTLGKTKIKINFSQKNRTGRRTKNENPSNTDIDLFLWDGIQQNEFIYNVRRKSVQEINKLNQTGVPAQLNTINSNPSEMGLLSAGPIHSGSGLTIDMSSIIFKNNLYWPRITIVFGAFSSILSAGAIPCLGGITMLGSTIQLYTSNMVTQSTVTTSIANGSVIIGTDKTDRFYFDGKDKERSLI